MMTSMRTIIDLPDEQIRGLRALCERQGISRAQAIRRAVQALLEHDSKEHRVALLEAGFGAWAPHKVDARALVDELRAEWDDRERRLGL